VKAIASLVSLALFALTANATVNIEMVNVGNPGNGPDAEIMISDEGTTGYGSVDYNYQIGKYEVTAGQYTEFLNSVAKFDPAGLYNTSMGRFGSEGGAGANIQRTGSSPNFSYSVAADWANRPVNYVSIWDAVRFANWLHNGQPTGGQGPETTEDGAYQLLPGSLLTRKAGARFFIPTENEWYKAAYHMNDGVTGNYWDYPTASNSTPINTLPDPGNHANFYNPEGTPIHTIGSPYFRTNVGEFVNSASPYGTFDQGGNVFEWTETGPYRGGNVFEGDESMRASWRLYKSYLYESYDGGFRVASAQVQGIDVSANQGTINWSSVKNGGISFAFTKATEGVGFTDSKFAANMSAAKAAGVIIGPYHFARPDTFNTDPNDAANEANDFVDTIQSYYQGTNLTLRPVIDLEMLAGVGTPSQEKTFLSQWMRNFIAVVHSRLGIDPMIYVNKDFAQNYLDSDLAQYPLWIVKLTSATDKNDFSLASPPTNSELGIWSTNGNAFWQWSWNGNVGGINPVDRDAFNGTMQQLSAYITGFHAGDFDNSGVVDTADYVTWRKTLGQTVNPGTGADANFSGTIDSGDYMQFRSYFDKTYSNGTGAALDSASLPEPVAILLVTISVISLVARRSMRCRLGSSSRSTAQVSLSPTVAELL
jgi:GH25 family lysozyme M1 (1,4-beta-N-acetylmuramidase)